MANNLNKYLLKYNPGIKIRAQRPIKNVFDDIKKEHKELRGIERQVCANIIKRFFELSIEELCSNGIFYLSGMGSFKLIGKANKGGYGPSYKLMHEYTKTHNGEKKMIYDYAPSSVGFYIMFTPAPVYYKAFKNYKFVINEQTKRKIRKRYLLNDRVTFF